MTVSALERPGSGNPLQPHQSGLKFIFRATFRQLARHRCVRSISSHPELSSSDPTSPSPDRMSDAELLDLLIAQEPPRGGALLAACGSLRRLSTRSASELGRQHGLDAATAHRLAGLFVLAQRIAERKIPPGAAFLNPRQIFEHFHPRLRDRKKEVFCVVLLDARHRVMGQELISEGSLTSSLMHPREVFVPAVRE